MLQDVLEMVTYYVKYILPFHFMLSFMIGICIGKYIKKNDENNLRNSGYHYEERKRSLEYTTEYEVDTFHDPFTPVVRS